MGLLHPNINIYSSFLLLSDFIHCYTKQNMEIKPFSSLLVMKKIFIQTDTMTENQATAGVQLFQKTSGFSYIMVTAFLYLNNQSRCLSVKPVNSKLIFSIVFLKSCDYLLLRSCLLLTPLVYLDMEIGVVMVLQHVCSKILIAVNRRVTDNLKHK